MLAVPGNFTVELPRKLINICLVSHLDCQCQKIQHKWNFFRIDIYMGQQNTMDCISLKRLKGRKNVLHRRGEWTRLHPGQHSISFNENMFHWISFPSTPRIPAPSKAQSGRNACSVPPKWLPENLEKYTASYSQGSTSPLHRKEHGCVFKVPGWTFRGTLTYKYSPGHRYRNSIGFFKTCSALLAQNESMFEIKSTLCCDTFLWWLITRLG